ncbi:acyl-CoA dehydrogenase family protein [Mycolicibacterium psychrotolerans]|uniref:Acyl-CoA oxidase/dehydrogenase middle domain-containing protein n=1 Tax=Mycolicibacterium psychrotolerans TaxID=216929 RepID=A0A7I7MDH8_9MYCO|nr:hypothetical protein MPSYJ_36860 [Mycolicibacterium psychrotolerans]
MLRTARDALAAANRVAAAIAPGSAERERADAVLTPQLLLSHYVIAHNIAGLGARQPAPRIFADLLAGAQLGNATAERGTAHALDRRTTATRRVGDWVVNGTKYYATGTLGAAWIAVSARIADRDSADTATLFVRPDQPGVTLHLEEWSAFGQRGTRSGRVTLRDVTVPADLVIDEGPPPHPADAPPSVAGAFDQALHGTRPPRLGLVY